MVKVGRQLQQVGRWLDAVAAVADCVVVVTGGGVGHNGAPSSGQLDGVVFDAVVVRCLVRFGRGGGIGQIHRRHSRPYVSFCEKKEKTKLFICR